MLKDASFGRAKHLVALVPSASLHCIIPWDRNDIHLEEETYKVDMLVKYRNNEAFEVINLVSFDVGIRVLNLRTYFPKEEGKDRYQGRAPRREGKNPSIKPKESGEEIAKEDELIIGLGIPMRGRVKRPKWEKITQDGAFDSSGRRPNLIMHQHRLAT